MPFPKNVMSCCSADVASTGPAQGDCTDADPYYNYSGAVRCLMEGAGDCRHWLDACHSWCCCRQG